MDAGIPGGVLLVLLMLALACAPGPEAPAPRNLLLVTLDTTRADFVSGAGGPPGVTPNLALLASVSTVFTEARSDSNVTNPSHVSILSGLPLGAHGVANNRTVLPASVDTLPEAFARKGFATAGFVGAAHVGPRLGWRGFDRLEGPKHRATAEEVTDLAIAWLREPRELPFFLWVHYFDPHMVYSADAKTIRAFYDGDPRAGEGPPIRETPAFRAGAPREAIVRWLGDARDPAWPRALYAAALHDTDATLGRLLRAVPASDTAFVVTADHGESLGEHRIFYDHVGLFETQLRVPLLIRVPGLPPQRSDLPVSTLDLAPTLAELFDLDLDLGEDGPGLSLVPALLGEPDDALRARDAFVFEHAHRHALAIRDGDWKLVWQRRPVPPLLPGVTLFHLPTDPGEERDVAAQHPDRVATLLSALEARAGEHAPAPPEQSLSDEAREQLRALGYAEP